MVAKTVAWVLLCVRTPLKISRECCIQNQHHYKQTQPSLNVRISHSFCEAKLVIAI